MTDERAAMPAADVVRAWAAAGELDDLWASDRLVLFDIAERAGSTGRSWESAAAIAARWHLNYRSVRRAFAKIETTGIVQVEHRAGQPARFSFLHHPAVAEWVALSTTPRAYARGEAEIDPARIRADPARIRALPRAYARAEPMNPNEPSRRTSANVCTLCGGLGWLNFDEDSRTWLERCSCVSVKGCSI